MSEVQIEQTIIKLTDSNLVEIETLFGDNRKTIKNITYDELVNLLISSKIKIEKETSMSSGILPNNDITGIQTFTTTIYDSGKQVIGLYRKPQKTKITYYDDTYTIPMPGMVFFITYNKEQVRTVSVACVLDRVLTSKSVIYKYPFSNVSGGSHRICFGRNNIFDIAYPEPADLHSIPSMFLAMPNNDDSYGRSNLSGLAQRKLLEKLDGKEEFPKEFLSITDDTLTTLSKKF